MSKENLNRSQLLNSDNGKCTHKVIAQTAYYVEVGETCAAPKASKTHFKFDAKSPQSHVANVNCTHGEGGTVHVEMSGHWLGTTCKKGNGE